MPALTGVRAIAAYLVFLHHYNRSEFPPLINRMLWEFHIGVNIFFVLSGFLIYFRYFEDVSLHRPWLKTYFVNRFARIYPIYFILTILTFAFGPFVSNGSPFLYGDAQNHFKLLLLNLSFLKGFFSHLNFTGIAQSWTLTIEECFYALAPLLFLIIKKQTKAFYYLPLAIFFIGILFVRFFGRYSEVTHGFYGDNTFMYLYTFNGTCMEFFIGMALAKVVLNGKDETNSAPVFTSLGLLIMLLTLIVLCSFKQDNVVISGLYHPLGTFVDHVFLPIGTAVFLYGLIKERSIIKNILEAPVFVLLGKSSYVFYLIHVGLFSVFLSAPIEKLVAGLLNYLKKRSLNWIPTHTDPRGIIFIAIMFLLMNLISIIIFKLAEEPLNKMIRKLGESRSHVTQTAPES
jgi:peptidoglycan/LPS O-acetylase OafA/YrhL